MQATARISQMVKKTVSLLPAALLVGSLLSGCAGKTAGPAAPVFFPPPPIEPHVQYLMGVNDSTDIQGKPSDFSLLLTGKEQGTVVKQIGRGYGVTAHKGKVYIASMEGAQIIIIDFVKKTFEFLKGNVRGPGQLMKPVNTAFDKDGNLYVADVGRDEIVVYDQEGNYLKSMGRIDDKTHRHNVAAVAVYDEYVYLLDNKGSELRVLDRSSGEVVKTIGSDPEPGPQNLALPSNVALDSKGFIYVTNIGRGNVIEYDSDGHYLTSFGQVSDTPGSFARPKGIAVDEDGWIFVVDGGFSNVQVFANEGKQLLGYFGNPGLPAGSLNLPAGIAVSRDNLEYFQKLAAPGFELKEVVYVLNQTKTEINPFLSIYGVGEMKGKKGSTGTKPVAPAEKAKQVQPADKAKQIQPADKAKQVQPQ